MSTPADASLELTPPPSGGTSRASTSRAWYLPTNQLNLMFMLAAGLVMGPAGFGRKYFPDALAACPGWIPLFAEAIPRNALEQAVSEGPHLRPVVAAVDLAPLRGEVQALRRDGTPHPIQFPEGLIGDEYALLVPAPLPATWIRSIRFASKEERSAVEDDAKDYANVPLAAYKRQLSPKLFAAGSACPWPPVTGAPPNRDQPIHAVAGVGGTMALLCSLGNIDDSVVEASRVLFEPQGDWSERGTTSSLNQLLLALHRWACLSGPADDQDIQGRMLLLMLHALVDAKTRADEAATAVAPDLHQTVLDCLADQGQRLMEDKWRSALERLAGDLKSLMGLGADTVSETLDRHSRPFSRGLILFFLRDSSQDLIDFRHPLLTPMDHVVAAALFAARSGWMGLPPDVRNLPGLREAVTHRMAALAHRTYESGLDLGPAPERVQPLREHLGNGAGTWTKVQQEAALKLARGMGWSQLLLTRVSLGRGDYRLQIDGRGAHLLLEGEVKAVTTTVDREALLARLAEAAIPAKIETQVRSVLKL